MEVFHEATIDLLFPTRLPDTNTLLPEQAELVDRPYLFSNECARGYISLTHPLLHGDKTAFLDRLSLYIWLGTTEVRKNIVRVNVGDVDVVRVRKEASHGILVPFQLDLTKAEADENGEISVSVTFIFAMDTPNVLATSGNDIMAATLHQMNIKELDVVAPPLRRHVRKRVSLRQPWTTHVSSRRIPTHPSLFLVQVQMFFHFQCTEISVSLTSDNSLVETIKSTETISNEDDTLSYIFFVDMSDYVSSMLKVVVEAKLENAYEHIKSNYFYGLLSDGTISVVGYKKSSSSSLLRLVTSDEGILVAMKILNRVQVHKISTVKLTITNQTRFKRRLEVVVPDSEYFSSSSESSFLRNRIRLIDNLVLNQEDYAAIYAAFKRSGTSFVWLESNLPVPYQNHDCFLKAYSELDSKQSASMNLHFITLGGENSVKMLSGVYIVDMETRKEVGHVSDMSVLVES